MIGSLDELSQYIRQTVPDPRSILNLKVNDKLGAVSFIWHGVEFLVKPSMHVFEVRGYNLYITGISTLLQASPRIIVTGMDTRMLISSTIITPLMKTRSKSTMMPSIIMRWRWGRTSGSLSAHSIRC